MCYCLFPSGRLLFGSLKWLHAVPWSDAGSRPAGLDPRCTVSCLALGWLVLGTWGLRVWMKELMELFLSAFHTMCSHSELACSLSCSTAFYYSVDVLRKNCCTSRLLGVLDSNWDFQSFYLSLKYKPVEWERQREVYSLPYLSYRTLCISVLFESRCSLLLYLATNQYWVLCTLYSILSHHLDFPSSHMLNMLLLSHSAV